MELSEYETYLRVQIMLASSIVMYLVTMLHYTTISLNILIVKLLEGTLYYIFSVTNE